MNKDKFTPEKAVRARATLGLSQREVASDIREMTDGVIALDHTKLSRFERGLINLSDKALNKLVSYYDRKGVEKGVIDDVELEEEVEPETDIDDIKVAEVPEPTQSKVVQMPKRRKSVNDDGFGDSGIEFDGRLDSDAKGALLIALNEFNNDIDEALEYRAKKGFFGYSDSDDEKALELVFNMAAAYNITRTLQRGRGVLPAFQPEKLDFEDGSLLAVLKSSYPDYVKWFFRPAEDAEEQTDKERLGLL